MTAEDQNLVVARLHHATVILDTDGPENVGREQELDDVKRAIKLAERVASGKATAHHRAVVPDSVHLSVRTTFGL